MRPLKNITLLLSILLICVSGYTQKQRFDVISYTAPKGWQQQQNEGGVQLSVTDKKTGAYAIALITKATATDGSAQENFHTDWNKLVKASVLVSAEPAPQDLVKENGWDIISGTAHYTDGEQKGLATLLTATGGGQMASVVLMTNTDKYQTELLAFINSLDLAKVSANIANNKNTPAHTNGSSIVGMWVFYNTETNGTYNQLTGGYMRREYVFYDDGTYQFRAKDWMVYVKDILFVHETGSYSINGNKITITPKKGKGEWWSKAANGKTSGWGKLVRAAAYKSETIGYTFQMINVPDENKNKLILTSLKPTFREGSSGTNANEHHFYYESRNSNESLIDNPPGFTTGIEKKPLHNKAAIKPANTKINSPIAGKTWQSQSLEKHGAAYGNMSGFHTGGFWLYQYKFNTDGTYRFVYNAASAVATNPVHVLQYESGTYAVNGNSIIITAISGTNEEWSVGKINNGMSAETIRKVLETRIKKIKSTARKLEKITYPFSVEYWQGNDANALCLQHTQDTQREGSPGQNNQSCFFETTKTL